MTTKQHISKPAGTTEVVSRTLGAGKHFFRPHQEAVAFAAAAYPDPSSGRCVVGSGWNRDSRGLGRLGLAADQPGPAILA